jgi:beta-glucosidase
MKTKQQIIFTILIFFSFNVRSENINFEYRNKNLTVKKRVDILISQMTLKEKIAQMNMKSLRKIKIDKQGNIQSNTVEDLFNGESIGCLESPFVKVGDIAKVSEAADQYLRAKTRLGIPAIQIAECLHGQLAFGATIFPQAIAQGSTWNRELIKEMSSVIAQEASLSGVDQALSPLFDLARDPRYGRVEECYGEDPFHVAEIGKAFVEGLQGDPKETKIAIKEGKIAAMAKHYVAYSTPLGGINLGPNQVGPRDLRSLHLYPFQKAVQESNIYSVMPSYNELNGIPLHAHKYLLKDVLRDEYGFEGYVFSDYGATGMMEFFHKISSDSKHTAKLAIKAGVDVEAPNAHAYKHLEELVNSGKLDIKFINTAVRNILTVKFKLGLFDREFKAKENIEDLVHVKKSVELARKISEESIVLLKNQNILPFDKNNLKSIALIGPNADRVQFGDYSCSKDKSSGVTLYEGLQAYLPRTVKINYAEGCDITSQNRDGFKNALEQAKKSEVVVMAVGGTSMILSGIGWGNANPNDRATCGEGYDRATIKLPGVQQDLIKEIKKLGKPIVLVLVHGRAYNLTWESENVDAIVDAWYPGEEGGNAITNILFGEVAPSGKLTVSYPKSSGHIPTVYNHKPSGRGYYHNRGTLEKSGRDYVFSSPDPTYCFGHGLSYTKFEYSDLKIENNKLTKNEPIKFSMKVKNIGKIQAKEVVQVYINDLFSSVSTPVKQLKEFKKILLNPNQQKEISFEIQYDELGLWNSEMDYVVEEGEFEIQVGASSGDIRLKGKVEVITN